MSDKAGEIRRKRILALDLLRGFFLVCIILNHIPFSPKFTDVITGNSALFASVAEGFFILSGIMVGYLYLPKIISHTTVVIKKIWSRAILLYVLSIITTVVFTIWGRISFDVSEDMGLYTGPLLSFDFLHSVLSLQYLYGWADFLARYAVFMAFAPFALLLIAHRKTLLLVGLSVFMWFIAPKTGYLVDFTAWQILFTAGIIIGSKLDILLSYKAREGHFARICVRFLLTLGILSFLWSLYINVLYPEFIGPIVENQGFMSILYTLLNEPYKAIEPLFDKEKLGILRLVTALLWFLIILLLFRKYEKPLHRYSLGLLAYFGRNSLATYVIHSVFIFITALVFVAIGDQSRTLNTVIGLLVVLFVVMTLYSYNKVLSCIHQRYTI